MATSRPMLDQAPPPPANLQAAPSQANAAQLAGGQQATPEGSAGLAQAVAQKGMFIEQAIIDLQKMLPSASGPLDGLIDQFRKIVGGALSAGVAPPAAPSMMLGGTPSMAGPTGTS